MSGKAWWEVDDDELTDLEKQMTGVFPDERENNDRHVDDTFAAPTEAEQ